MKPRWNPLAAASALLIITMLFSACANKGSSNSGSSPAPEVSPANTAADKGFPRKVTSAGGEEVTIQAKPKRVALVHWGLTEHILSFDLPALAVALPFTEKQSMLRTEAYKPYTDKYKEIAIVGENTKVNLEALLQYSPDLILAGSGTNKEIADNLKKIAPTVFIDEEKTNVWSDWQGVMTQFGEVLGQEDKAKGSMDTFGAKVEQAKKQLAVKGKVAYVQVREKQIWLQGTNYAGQYYEPLGLQAPKEAVGEGAELTLEGLAALNPDYLFLGYFNYNDKSLPALTDEWKDNNVWKSLKAVQMNHVYGINGELAYGFGPISKMYGIDAIVKALK